jgi:hypothetical protein
MSQITVLAQIPNRAQVVICRAGCAHLTYPPVTLHFPHWEEMMTTIRRYLELVAPQIPDGDSDTVVEVACGPVSLYLRPDQARELTDLMRQAAQAVYAEGAESPKLGIPFPFPSTPEIGDFSVRQQFSTTRGNRAAQDGDNASGSESLPGHEEFE